MPPSAKTIREDLARAKAAYAKNDDLRFLHLILSALRSFVTVRPTGPDRIQAEGLFRECCANLVKLDRVKKYLPQGLPFIKGQEKQLYAQLMPVARAVQEDLNRESLQAMRERKLRIDQAIIKGTKLLGEGNLAEAQRNFRAAVEDYVDEKAFSPSSPLVSSRPATSRLPWSTSNAPSKSPRTTPGPTIFCWPWPRRPTNGRRPNTSFGTARPGTASTGCSCKPWPRSKPGSGTGTRPGTQPGRPFRPTRTWWTPAWC